jgi:branched-chain amino acid transport system ATP-binding protein
MQRRRLSTGVADHSSLTVSQLDCASLRHVLSVAQDGKPRQGWSMSAELGASSVGGTSAAAAGPGRRHGLGLALTRSTPMTALPALEVSELSVHFAGVFALDKVSLSVAEGTIHGIIGPNGSGKTTLLNSLSGFVPCSGEAKLFGEPILRLSPYRRAICGLGRTFQNPKIDHSLTVRDVLPIGEHKRRVRPFWKEAFAPWLADLDAQPDIAMMHDQMSRLRARGVTIVVVEHNVRFLSDVCDRVTVLDAGRCIADGGIAEVLRLPQVLKAYMGEDALPDE